MFWSIHLGIAQLLFGKHWLDDDDDIDAIALHHNVMMMVMVMMMMSIALHCTENAQCVNGPKGQVCRTHATPDRCPSPDSDFLRVLANYAKIPIYMPCFFCWKKSKLFCVAFVFFYIDPHDSGLQKSHLPPPKHVWGGLQGWSKGHILADFQGIISTLKKN